MNICILKSQDNLNSNLPAPIVRKKGIKSKAPAFPVTVIIKRSPYAFIKFLCSSSSTKYLSAYL